MEEGHIEYGDNIIKRIAERRGIPYQEVKEMIDLNIMHIGNLANAPEVTGIYLGKNLGKMVSSSDLLVTHIKRFKDRANVRRSNYAKEILEPRLERIKEFFKEQKREGGLVLTNYNNTPFINMLSTKLSKLYGWRFNTTENPQRLWEKLSEVQNKITVEMENRYREQ